MSNRPLLIIHGWSDSSSSFEKLAKIIESQIGRYVQEVNLADYVSMDDAVTFYDIAAAMQKAWLARNLPTEKGKVDVIAHSAGALVLRTWLQIYYSAGNSPIKNLVLLAPANFGSHLAHKGRAFFGRVIEGFNSKKMFQVGTQLLKGLELASPFTFNLALADCFNDQSYFGPGNILCTVLTGNHGYTGISAAANEDGTDGVVRIAAANLNCAILDVDFSENMLEPTYNYLLATGKTAFAIIDGENHSTIVNKDNGFASDLTLPFIIQGLMVNDKEFADWCKKTEQHTQEVVNRNINNRSKHGFQNTVSFVTDQFNTHIHEYFLEFYGHGENTDKVAELLHGDIIRNVHRYGDDNTYRSLYMDCTTLYQHFAKNRHPLLVSLTALPIISKQGEVGYRTFTDEDIGSIVLQQSEIATLFQENRTLLVRIKLRREQSSEVFAFKKSQ